MVVSLSLTGCTKTVNKTNNKKQDYESRSFIKGKIREVGDATTFLSKHPEGFKFKFYKLCEL